MANLIATETPDLFKLPKGQAFAQAVFHPLRPYGGVACTWGPLADRRQLEELVQDKAYHGAVVRQTDDFVLLVREGSLPGAADWSHSGANAANTGASQDDFIQAPMNILWFDAAQRWHKFPGQNQTRIVRGRLVLFEEGVLRASDVYTGRILWETEVSLGKNPLAGRTARDAASYAKHRQWGPKASLEPSTQLVVTADTIYLSEGTSCLTYDSATGKPIGSIDLPEGNTAPWTNLRACDKFLIGNSGPNILCFDRQTGDLVWSVEATLSSLSIALGEDKVFCSELINPKRGEDENRAGGIFALDLATGKKIWQRDGSARLRYSQSSDTVVTPKGLYRGSNGEPIQLPIPQAGFTVKGRGLPETGMPAYVAGDKLLAGNEETLIKYDITTGEQIGGQVRWTRRGCTGTRASRHLLTTRFKGNSAWVDLHSGEITPLLGIRPGCQVNNNLYPANGVLNIPNLTAGCTCNYTPISVACVPASVVKGPEEKQAPRPKSDP